MKARGIFERPMSSPSIVVVKIGGGYVKAILEYRNGQEMIFGQDLEELLVRLQRRAKFLPVDPQNVLQALEIHP
jgi:hypothetical protein